MVLLPTQVFYSAAIKSRFRPLSCTGIPGCRSTAVCPAVVPLVTLAGESSRAGLWNLTHLPVWSARWQRSLDNSPSCLSVNHSGPGRCPQTWLRQWKGQIAMGEFFFHLAAVLFWQNLGIKKKKKGVSFLSVYFSNRLGFYLWMHREWCSCPSCTTAPLQGGADEERKRPWKGLVLSP